MSRFNYKNHPVISRVDRISVSPTEDYPEIVNDNNLNRVQTVLKIRETVRDAYYMRGFKDVSVKFVDGVIDDMIATSQIEGRPLPAQLIFDVEVTMPKVVEIDSAARMKTNEGTLSPEPPKDDQDRSYKNYGAYNQNDHIYWT